MKQTIPLRRRAGARPRSLAALMLAGFLAGVGIAQEADDPPAGAPRSVAELIADLGSRSFAEREAAELDLVARGEEARVELLKCRKSSDPEVRWRAARALAELDRRAGAAPAPSGERPRLRDLEPEVIDPDDPVPGAGQRRELEGSSESEDGRFQRRYRIEGSGLTDEEWDRLREDIERNPSSGLDSMLREQHERMRELESELFRQFGGREDPWSLRLHAGSIEEMNEMVEQLQRQLDEAFARDLGTMPGGSSLQDDERFFDTWLEDLRSGPGVFPPAPTAPELPPGPRLGVMLEDVSPALAAQLDLTGATGVLVREIVPGSIAERAGVQPWDVILSIAGTPVSSGLEVVQALGTVEVGGVVELQVVRKARRQLLQAERDR